MCERMWPLGPMHGLERPADKHKSFVPEAEDSLYILQPYPFV